MRDSLHYRPQLTKDQFLSKGFAERKIMMTYDLLKLCQSMHNQLQPHDTRKPKKTTHHPQLVESTELQLSPISSPLKSNVDTTNSPHHDVLVQVIREQASPVDKNEQGQKSISNWQQKQTTPDRPALRPNLGGTHAIFKIAIVVLYCYSGSFLCEDYQKPRYTGRGCEHCSPCIHVY